MHPVVYFGFGLAVALGVRANRAPRAQRKAWLTPAPPTGTPPTRPLRKAILHVLMGGIVAAQTVTSLGNRTRNSLRKWTP
jgi:hypothetical protein